MPATASSAAIEKCPDCALPTAAHFFREFGKKRLCLLCVRREEETAATLRAQIGDQTTHGGPGWLRKRVLAGFTRSFSRSNHSFRF